MSRWSALICSLVGTLLVLHAPVAQAVTPVISLGARHTMAVKADGTLWGWGYNTEGALGNGTGEGSDWPVRIGAESSWLTVSSGRYFNVALRQDGSMWAWGANSAGQLGDGSGVAQPTPVPIGEGETWAQVAAGSYHVLALTADGRLFAWGQNSYGQLGDGTTTASPTPMRIGSADDWLFVSAGSQHSLGIREDGTLWAWGRNSVGQLGDGSTTNRYAPKQIGASTWKAVCASSGSHSLGIRTDGSLWTWGGNSNGKLGDGSTTNRTSPVAIAAGETWTAATGNDRASAAIRADGTLWAWGEGMNGCVGDGEPLNESLPVMVDASPDWVNVAGGGLAFFAVKSDASAWGWGDPDLLGWVEPVPFGAPRLVETETSWSVIGAGSYNSLGLGTDGSLFVWGQNFDGQAGQGEATWTWPTPARIPGTWVHTSVGLGHVLAVASDGSLWGWGANYSGQVGDGTTDDRYTPVLVDDTYDWLKVSASGTHSLAIRSDGSLWAWGRNFDGQLGIGTSDEDPHPTPVRVGEENNWTAIFSESDCSFGIKSDNSLWAWGSNGTGALGTGASDFDPHPFPQEVGAGIGWARVAPGWSHFLAVTADGALYSWGSDGYGQLGRETSVPPALVPGRIGEDNDWTDAAARSRSSWAVKSDGSLWAWGSNSGWDLGTGSSGEYGYDSPWPFFVVDPLRVGTDADWEQVVTGHDHTLARKSDGSLWAWGTNDGTFGNGMAGNAFVPVMVMDLDLAPPPAPSWLVADDAQNLTRVGVEWEDVEGETGYRVYHTYYSPDGFRALLLEGGVTRFTDVYFCDTDFYYMVSAYNAGGESPLTAVEAGSTYPCAAPPAPANVQATDGTVPDAVRVTWDDVPAEDGYRVYRVLTYDWPMTYEQLGEVGSGVTSFDVPGACGDAAQDYAVRAFNEEGTGACSDYDAGYPAVCPPPVPDGVAASDGVYTDRVVVTWSDVTDEDGYHVFRAEASDGEYVQLGSTGPDVTTYDDDAAACGQTFWYRVTSFNAGGDSEPSSGDSGHDDYANSPPTADAGGPYVGELGSGLQLDGTGSSDPDGGCGDSIVAWEWDLDGDASFGDATGEEPALSWAAIETLICGGAGLCETGTPYEVSLRVTDSEALSVTATAFVTLYDNTPTAGFAAAPNPALCGETVSFDGSASSHGHPGHSILLHEWDFDYTGAFSADATGVDAAHAFGTIGTHAVALRVADDNVPPRTDIATVDVEVGIVNQPPVADAGGPYSCTAGEPLVLDASGSADPDEGCGDSIVSWEWDLDGDGFFDDASGGSPSFSWEEAEGIVCGGRCDTETAYPIGLRVTDSLGGADEGVSEFTASYCLFFDDFSDGVKAGDPDWEEVTGNWLVNEDRYFFVSAKLKIDTAVAKPIKDLAAGCLCLRLKLTPRYVKRPNASIVFDYQDPAHFRYVTVKKRKLIIGQKGDYASETNGVKASSLRSFKLGTWYDVWLDLFPDGQVDVYVDAEETPAVSYSFPTPSLGGVGCRAVKAKSLFDDYTVWHEGMLP